MDVIRPRRLPRLALLTTGLLLAVVAFATVSCQGLPMKPVDGRLPECPGTPNCLNTQAGDASPLAYEGSPIAALARLRVLIESMPRTTIIDEGEGYLHAEFRSALFRFVDDVQALVDEEARVIHLRSASRVGYSDLGANRRRLESLRAAWVAAPTP